MNNKILFLFLIIFFISSNKSFSQTFEVKSGVGIYNVYNNDILTGRPRNVKFKPSPFVSFLLDWELSDNIFMGWENRIRIKSGEITYLGLDTTINKIATRHKSARVFYNADVKANLSYHYSIEQDFEITLSTSLGFSYEFLDNSPRPPNYVPSNDVILFPEDERMPPENESIFKRSGFIGGACIKILYKKIICGVSSDFEFYDTFLYNVGEPSYLYTTFFIGYRF